VKKNCICVFIACAICAFIGCRSTAAVSAQNSDAKAKDQKTHRRSAAEQPVDMQTPSVADKDKPNVRLAGKDTASPEIETPSLPTPEGGTAEASESGEAGGMAAEANSELALISEEPAVMLEEAVSPFFMNDSMPVETAAAKAAEQMSAAEAEPEAVAGAEKNARTPSVADEDKPQVRLAGKDTASPEIETPSLPAPEGETAKDSESGEVDGMAAESEKSKTLSDESAAPIVEAEKIGVSDKADADASAVSSELPHIEETEPLAVLPRESSSETQSGDTSRSDNDEFENSGKLIEENRDKAKDEFTADEAAENESEILPERVIDTKLDQVIEIAYPGKNWVFLGENDVSRPSVVRFDKRLFSDGNTRFLLQAKAAGEGLLHFYKHDALKNIPIDKYIAVRVSGANDMSPSESIPVAMNGQITSISAETENETGIMGKNKTVQMQMTSPAEMSRQDTMSGETGEDSDSGTSLPEDGAMQETVQTEMSETDPETLYKKAETAFNEKKYGESMQALSEYEMFEQSAPDKALFLRARILESESDYRNIKGALEIYEKIVASFPESDLRIEAVKRLAYIKRFYIRN